MSMSVAISRTADAATGRGRPRGTTPARPALTRIFPPGLPVPADTLEIWLLATDHAGGDGLAHLVSLLSQAEQARCARFLRPEDRGSYVATRAALRMVLSDSIGVAPDAIKLDQNPWGKPVLAADHACHNLDFSVSHSGRLSAIALSRTGAVGIDIERRREVSHRHRIVEDLLGDGAAVTLAGLPPQQQDEAFLRLWTATEAVVKAAGTGLAGNRNPIPLALAGDGLPRLAPHRVASNARRWSLVPIDPSPGYVGSLVIEADDDPVPVCE